MVEMGAPAVSRDIESVDAHCRTAGRSAERTAVNATHLAFREEKARKLVIADESHRLDWKFGIEALEVERHIEARSPALAVDRQNLVGGVLIGPARDRLIEINAPGP